LVFPSRPRPPPSPCRPAGPPAVVVALRERTGLAGVRHRRHGVRRRLDETSEDDRVRVRVRVGVRLGDRVRVRIRGIVDETSEDGGVSRGRGWARAQSYKMRILTCGVYWINLLALSTLISTPIGDRWRQKFRSKASGPSGERTCAS